MSYPPQLSREHSSDLVSSVRDWQFQHGSLLKAPPRTGNVLARPIGVTLFPTLFPKDLFEEARELQRIYNKLYTAIAADETWLGEVLKEYSNQADIGSLDWSKTVWLESTLQSAYYGRSIQKLRKKATIKYIYIRTLVMCLQSSSFPLSASLLGHFPIWLHAPCAVRWRRKSFICTAEASRVQHVLGSRRCTLKSNLWYAQVYHSVKNGTESHWKLNS